MTVGLVPQMTWVLETLEAAVRIYGPDDVADAIAVAAESLPPGATPEARARADFLRHAVTDARDAATGANLLRVTFTDGFCVHLGWSDDTPEGQARTDDVRAALRMLMPGGRA